MKTTVVIAALAVLAALAAPPAAAQALDGKAPIICATGEVHDCAVDSECIADDPDAFNLPRFIRIDLAAKKAITQRASGEERTAEIGQHSIEDGRIILQGVQLGLPWSMLIVQETGTMSATIAGDRLGFVVFGHCAAM
jgi:hypothetical protein